MNNISEYMDKESINKRFVEAANYLLSTNIVANKGAISESLNIKPSKFSEILNFRMNAGTDLIATLSDLYNIDANWLLTGRPPMLKSEPSPLIGEQVPVSTSQSAEVSVYYKMYKEERAKAESLAEQIGVLKQTIRQLEEKIEGLQSFDAGNASDNGDARDAGIADVG